MFKIFENIDKQIENKGYKITHQSWCCITYERFIEQFGYIHGVELIRKSGRVPVILSYEKNTRDKEDFDNCVGLPIDDIQLFIKKIKKLKWNKKAVKDG